jgi:hypothetical protein
MVVPARSASVAVTGAGGGGELLINMVDLGAVPDSELLLTPFAPAALVVIYTSNSELDQWS